MGRDCMTVYLQGKYREREKQIEKLVIEIIKNRRYLKEKGWA
jgi:hypothetical protein